MTRNKKNPGLPSIHELPLDSDELVTLGYAFSVEQIKLLQNAGLPILWQPIGAVRTFKCLEEEAREVLRQAK